MGINRAKIPSDSLESIARGEIVSLAVPVTFAASSPVTSPVTGAHGALIWLEISERDDAKSMRGRDPDRILGTLVLANDLTLDAESEDGARVTIQCPRHALAVRMPSLADLDEPSRVASFVEVSDAAAASPEIVPMLSSLTRGARLHARQHVFTTGDAAIFCAHVSSLPRGKGSALVTLLARADRGDVTIEPYLR